MTMIKFRPKSTFPFNESASKDAHRAMDKNELIDKDIVLLSEQPVNCDEGYSLLAGQCDKIKDAIETASAFYCGITNDLVDRKYKHEHDDYNGKSIDKVYAVKCTDADTACKLEGLMHSVGFNTGDDRKGGNGAAPDTDYVYFYRIPK